MPNWVTNKIEAPEHVIRAMLNESGEVDFSTLARFEGPNDWDWICADAEEAAEIACGIPLSDNPVIAALQKSNREQSDIRSMREESFEQFIGMVRNYRECGYLHAMEFARDVWGTKWNAHESAAEPERGRCEFDTAWSCPIGVLKKLSERFPCDPISVEFADEDIGSNCGLFTLRGGEVVGRDVSPGWNELDEAGKARWEAFAYQVTGRQPDEDSSAS